jgi:hypothetical protein
MLAVLAWAVCRTLWPRGGLTSWLVKGVSGTGADGDLLRAGGGVGVARLAPESGCTVLAAFPFALVDRAGGRGEEATRMAERSLVAEGGFRAIFASMLRWGRFTSG